MGDKKPGTTLVLREDDDDDDVGPSPSFPGCDLQLVLLLLVVAAVVAVVAEAETAPKMASTILLDDGLSSCCESLPSLFSLQTRADI